jgi:multiple antibiotic resistance protein
MHATISELVRVSLLIVGALFPIIDSPDNIPIFLTLTAGLAAESRAVLARKIAVNSFGILIVAVLIGTHILAFFGISLPVVQVGGGLIVIAAGWRLLNRPDDDAKESATPVSWRSYDVQVATRARRKSPNN